KHGTLPGRKRSTCPHSYGSALDPAVVLDCESGPVRLGLAHRLAADLGATAVTLDELRAEGVAALVRDTRRADDPTARHSSVRKAA
ncbi:magnesium chelatase, partial [Kitasatospora sp. NPDC004240]